MSVTLNLGINAFSVQTVRRTQHYGQLAQVPLRAQGSDPAYEVLFRAALDKIPAGATVISAVVQFAQHADQNGTFDLRVNPHTGAWPAQVTWANRPATAPLAGQASRVNPRARDLYRVPVTAAVQQVVSRQRVDRGWRLSTTSTNASFKLRGTRAAALPPRMIVTYTTVPQAPTGLEPSDAQISLDKPVLLFWADEAISALQVQIDPAASASSPAWSSGTVPVTGGMLDLAETTYPGLPVGTATYWRVRQQTDGGWSPWSSWVSVTRIPRPALRITSPAGTPDAAGYVPVADGTPPITWSLDGVQVAWRCRLLAEDGDWIAGSGRVAGADTDWTPRTGLVTDGQRGLISLEVWDDSDRVALPGQPQQIIENLPIVLTTDGTIEGFTSLSGASDETQPLLTFTAQRSAIPDQVALTRSQTEVGRWNGADVCVPNPNGPGYLCTVSDPTARMRRPYQWRMVPVVNGRKGPGGNGISYTGHTSGIWLISRADPTRRVVLLGEDDQEQDQPETAIVHQPIGDRLVQPVVRRRLLRSAAQGTISGELGDVESYGWDAWAMERILRDWIDNDAGEVYWLVFGGYAGEVIVGDIALDEIPSHPGDGRRLAVSFNWWATTGAV